MPNSPEGKITANLPSRNFDTTLAFYDGLGFRLAWRSEGWMIVEKVGMKVEFFPHPDLDPEESWFSACLRLPDVEPLHNEWSQQGISTDTTAIPRLTAITEPTDTAPRMFYLVDPDGSLWRVIEDKDI
ncbi:bleomycin resistance protein [Aliiroseovarius sp. F47248L]|uniref:bleomycin resistance protein n=1 Tax=Aliiroseovarius sp. F47248L TaxID=2926420 RepID=UPI001FF1F3BE|nr:bleomycin resistance protein [Aliiroseovarius sp. F47248L]MCK0139180.1 bleomycin resistance protein [Aliiroseovarius sp. F47248L]